MIKKIFTWCKEVYSAIIADGTYRLYIYPDVTTLISHDVNLKPDQLQKLIKENKKVKKWEAAYPNEINNLTDIIAGTNFNSFQSLSLEAKAAATARAAAAKASLAASTHVQ